MAPARKRRTIPVIGPEWTLINMKAYLWCINNGVKISPWAAKSDRDNYYWWIDVDVNGAKNDPH